MSARDEPLMVSEGYPFVALTGFLALFFAAVDLHGPAWILFILTFAAGAFFRNPHRRIPEDAKAIVCPADGKVLEVQRVEAGLAGMIGPCWKVGIFMSPLNVHVNRSPVSGKVLRKTYKPGHFHVASRPEAGRENERMEMVLEAEAGFVLGVVQIAGVAARRIVCYPGEGDALVKGERFGLIRFGSRLEIYLPEGTTPAVRVGQHVKAGETIVGYGT
ncbi:MAG: phosphatidylserine decarboxylase family protein [bacterium]